MTGKPEAKVLYMEGAVLRVFRGSIESEDAHFICLKRRDGLVRLSKNYIVKIEQRGDEAHE